MSIKAKHYHWDLENPRTSICGIWNRFANSLAFFKDHFCFRYTEQIRYVLEKFNIFCGFLNTSRDLYPKKCLPIFHNFTAESNNLHSYLVYTSAAKTNWKRKSKMLKGDHYLQEIIRILNQYATGEQNIDCFRALFGWICGRTFQTFSNLNTSKIFQKITYFLVKFSRTLEP